MAQNDNDESKHSLNGLRTVRDLLTACGDDQNLILKSLAKKFDLHEKELGEKTISQFVKENRSGNIILAIPWKLRSQEMAKSFIYFIVGEEQIQKREKNKSNDTVFQVK